MNLQAELGAAAGPGQDARLCRTLPAPADWTHIAPHEPCASPVSESLPQASNPNEIQCVSALSVITLPLHYGFWEVSGRVAPKI